MNRVGVQTLISFHWPLLGNSLILSSLTVLASGFLGTLAALIMPCVPRPMRALLAGAAAVALVFPPFVAANCWMELLGEAGLLRQWLPLNLYSLPAAAAVMALLYWPVFFCVAAARFLALDGSLISQEPAARGLKLLRFIAWPLVRNDLAIASMVVFALTWNHFSIPALFQVKVYPAALWVSYNTRYDVGEALWLSMPMVLASAAVVGIVRRSPLRWRFPGGEGPATIQDWRRQLGWNWAAAGAGMFAMGIAASVLIPVSRLMAVENTWSELPSAWASSLRAVAHTLGFAAGTATIVTVVSITAWKRKGLEWLWAFFLIPGVTLGIVAGLGLGHSNLMWLFPSLVAVVSVYSLRFIAPGWQLIRGANLKIDPDLDDLARLAGISGWRRWWQVCWPQTWRHVLAAWYLVYLFVLWDTETLLMIVPPGAETLALRIFNLLHYGHNSQVNALCVILAGLALLPGAAFGLATTALGLCRRLGLNARRRAVLILFIGSVALFQACAPPAANAPVSLKGDSLFGSVQVIGSHGSALGQFHKPRSLALDALERVFVVDMTGRVQRFSAAGQFEEYWRMPETDKGKPKGMSLDGSGRVIVIEPHYSRINHFDSSGKLSLQWGMHGTNPGQLAFPRAIALASNGDVWVSEYGVVERVQRLSADGSQCRRVIGRAGAGPGEFNRVEGLAVDRNDWLYVADSCNHRVQVFDAAGSYVRTIGGAGSGPGQMSYPYDVRVDAEGLIFVCEFGNSRVQVFENNGRLKEIIGKPGAEPGCFSNPWSLALDQAGNLYVADSLNHRVQKFVRRRELAAARSPRGGGGTDGGMLR